MTRATKISVIAVGCVGILSALAGFYYNALTLSVALDGGFSRVAGDGETPYFYPAFYLMSAICVVCFLALLVVSIDLCRARLRWSRFFTRVVIFELIYFFSLGSLWAIAGLVPQIGLSIAAATGVACGGLISVSHLVPSMGTAGAPEGAPAGNSRTRRTDSGMKPEESACVRSVRKNYFISLPVWALVMRMFSRCWAGSTRKERRPRCLRSISTRVCSSWVRRRCMTSGLTVIMRS